MSDLLPTEQLLVAGGDERIVMSAELAQNKYGCHPLPDPQLAAFGSSTASVISGESFAAADRLRNKIILAAGSGSNTEIYARELDRIRLELMQLCGVTDLAGLEIVFASSGTELHLIAAQLAGGTASLPSLAIMVDAAETGSLVPAALSGRKFSSCTAPADSVVEEISLTGSTVEVVTVPIRLADGTPRPLSEVDSDVENLVMGATRGGRRVLLILVDSSKTGLVAPSPACVSVLHRHLSDKVDVLVDACQFRLAPSSLHAYLEHGFMVALTGSKFVTGPTFSGALLIPSSAAERLQTRPFPRALKICSARAEWPREWRAAEALENSANFGLLLRWEAALEELRAFRRIPEEKIAKVLREFSRAIQNRLESDPVFAALPVPEPNRLPLIENSSWDHIPTIFPFLLHHPQTSAGRRAALNREETAQVHQLLQTDLSANPKYSYIKNELSEMRFQLGQPVNCGIRNGVPVSALRLCASARLVVEAANTNSDAIIGRAMAALDKTALLVRARSIAHSLPQQA